MIDNIVIYFLFFYKFCKQEDNGYKKKNCYPMVNFSKFTFNKNILNGVVTIGYNQVFSQILPLNLYLNQLCQGKCFSAY